jgi:hypothetical protein
MRRGFLFLLCGLGSLASSGCMPNRYITEEELVRRTQELMNAVAVGDKTPWQRYFADDCMYFDEVGHNKKKGDLVNDLAPLPEGYSGSITVQRVQSHIESGVAILSYDLDEKEIVFGQEMTARYHATDTWMRRNGTWQVVAGQVFRYYEDPAAGEADPKITDYVGTYQLAVGKTLAISEDGRRLFRQRGDGPKVELIPEAAGVFFRKGVEGRILFRRGKQAQVDALIDRRNNEDVVWKKVESPSRN